MIIPDSYIVKLDPQDSFGQRDITIRRYIASVPFVLNRIQTGLETSILTYGSDFGVIKTYPSDINTGSIRSLWGLLGERSLVLLNHETNELDYIRIKNVLLATSMVEFIKNSENQLELMVYGSPKGRNLLWDILLDFGSEMKYEGR